MIEPYSYGVYYLHASVPGFREYSFSAEDSDGNLVGMLLGTKNTHAGSSRIHAISLVVAKDYRRCGLAGSLLARLGCRASEEGVEFVSLDVRRTNKAAIDLYKKCGFQEFAHVEAYYPDGEGALHMRKSVAEGYRVVPAGRHLSPCELQADDEVQARKFGMNLLIGLAVALPVGCMGADLVFGTSSQVA